MALAIINISPHIVSVSSFTLQPGGVVRLSAFYRDEIAARRDPHLVKLIDTNYLTIHDVDFDGIATIGSTIEKLEAADAERRRQEKLEAIKRRNERVAEHKRKAETYRLERQQERQQEEKAAAGPKQDLDLSELYEKNRKERLAHAVAVKQEAPSIPAQIQVQTTAPEPERIVRPEDLRKPSSPEEVTPVEVPTALKKGIKSKVDLDSLEVDVLKFILESYDIKKIPKTPALMLKAVKDLKVPPGELEELLEKYTMKRG